MASVQTHKPLHERSDEDIIRIIGEDFDASEHDRREKNVQNFGHYRAFHCRDILRSADMIKTVQDGELVFGGRMPQFNLGAIEINKTYLPWLRGITLTSVARLAHGLWPDFNDFWRLDPDDDEDEKAAEGGFALAQYFIRASRYKQEALLALLQCHLFDFSILFTGWKNEEFIVPVVKAPTLEQKDYATGKYHDTGIEDEERREVEFEEVVVGGWDVASINTLNFRYDPLASHEGFGEFCGVTSLISKRRVRQMVEANIWRPEALEEIQEDEPPNMADHPDTTDDMTSKLREDEKLQGGTLAGYIESRYVRADMHWTPGVDGSQCVMLNRNVVARADRSWRTPFYKQVFIQNPGMLPGTSLVEPLMPVQHDINRCLRLFRTQQEKAVMPDSAIDPTFFTSALEAEIQPWDTGAPIILTKNPEGRDPMLVRRFIEHPGARNAQDMWSSIQIQMQSGERTSGVGGADQGVAQGGASATEIARAAMAVDIRGALIEIYIEDSIVIAPFDDLLKLMTVNVREPMRIKIAGDEGMKWQTLNPKDLAFKKSPHVKALGMSSMSSRAVGAQAIRDVTMMLLQNPLTAQFMKTVSSMQDLYRQYDIDPDKYVNDEDFSKREAIPPKYVPVLLAGGQTVTINAWDDHVAVIEAIDAFRQGEKWATVPEENKRLMVNHVKQRKLALQGAQGLGPGMTSPASPYGGGGGAAGGAQPQPQPGGPNQPQQVVPASGGGGGGLIQQPQGAAAGGTP